MQAKSDTRRAIKERLARLNPKDRDIESRVICKELRKLLGDTPKTVAAYMPYLDEPDIKPLLQELLAAGWTVVMPAVENNQLVFRQITDLSQNRKHPVTGIMEAPPECPKVDDATIVDAIVPGRAFTRTGDRMGRGNGGYDIWIGHRRRAKASTRFVGVCFECQVMTELPMEAHDQKVDAVLTARGPIK